MKAVRTISLFLCVLFVSSIIYQAKAVDETSASVLEQCASEISQGTGYKYYINENTERYINYRRIHTDYTLDAIISYVNIGLDQYFYSKLVEIANPQSTNVLVNKYRPLPSDFVPSHLEKISSMYSYGTQKLTRDARLAFEKLCAASAKYGYPIVATSGYRSYDKQAQIYASFFSSYNPSTGIAPDLLAARPGFSEHQTGLAVDFSRANASVTSASVSQWLAKNAYKYGFIIRYPAGKEGVTGYTSEPWHLRFLGVQLATAVYQYGLTYDEYVAREIDIPVKSAEVTAIGVTAVSNITIDETAYQLSAYKVLGDTYYKLRDIAVILNGTPSTFDIAWNSETKTINMLSGVPYSSDLMLGAFEAEHVALMTVVKPGLQLGDNAFDPSAYTRDGANYFTLGDILTILGITATDDGTGNLTINTLSIPLDPSPDSAAPVA